MATDWGQILDIVDKGTDIYDKYKEPVGGWDDKTQPSNVPNTNNNKNVIYIVLGAVVVIFVLIFGIFKRKK